MIHFVLEEIADVSGMSFFSAQTGTHSDFVFTVVAMGNATSSHVMTL
jgi:hypothetical protein